MEAGDRWHSTFGLAMSLASELWGGFGFIYLPRTGPEFHPALARILTMYDPDYLVDAVYTHRYRGDRARLARTYSGWPTDPAKSNAQLSLLVDQQVVHEGLATTVLPHPAIGAALRADRPRSSASVPFRSRLTEVGRSGFP